MMSEPDSPTGEGDHTNAEATPIGRERRSGQERRSGLLLSLAYGSFRPRRRLERRVTDVGVFQVPDWHEPGLLYLVLGILMLCIADAVLTLNLLNLGAHELNFLMARLIEVDPYLFAYTKMFTTGTGLVVLALYARYCLFRRVLVHHVLYAFFAGYTVLIAYEVVLLHL